jgi:hypothetical protein
MASLPSRDSRVAGVSCKLSRVLPVGKADVIHAITVLDPVALMLGQLHVPLKSSIPGNSLHRVMVGE